MGAYRAHQWESTLKMRAGGTNSATSFSVTVIRIMKTHSKDVGGNQLCEICGRPIAAARLEALPGVTTCVDCARKKGVRVDPRKYDLSEASPINRNGFAPKD